MTYQVRGGCPCGASCTPDRTDSLRFALLDIASGLRKHVEQEHPGEGITDDDGLGIKRVSTCPERPDHEANMRRAHEFICEGFPVIIVCESAS